MVKVTWVYYLNREELLRYAEEFGFENYGTVEELRKRFASFIQNQGEGEGVQRRLTELALRHTRPNITINPATPREGVPSSDVFYEGAHGMLHEEEQAYVPVTPSYANIMDRVRKWGFRYDGGKDPLGFIERVEELADGYGLNRNSIPRALPELLKEKALVWFRNNNRHWQEWDEFKKDFLKFFLKTPLQVLWK